MTGSKVPVGLKLFYKRLRETPDREMYRSYCAVAPPADMTLRDAYEKTLSNPSFPANTKRRHGISFSRNRFEDSGLMGVRVVKLTYKKLEPFVRHIHKKFSSSTVDSIWYPFTRVVRFVGGGDIHERPELRRDTKVESIEAGEITIEHQTMSVENALDLTAKQRGRFSSIKENLKIELKKLAKGRAYVFKPADGAHEKDIAGMRISIYNFMQDTRLLEKYAMKFSTKKKVFAFFHKEDLKPQGDHRNATR